MNVSKEWLTQNLNVVKTTRKCQRNWDHNQVVPKEHIQHLIDVAVNTPTKQDENYFDLYVVTNRDKLKDLYLNHSWGFVVDYDKQYRNPQVDGHVMFFWARRIPDTNRNAWVDGSLKESQPFSRMWTNCLTAIGISSGIVAVTAAQMGYATAFCKNHFQQPHSYDAWIDVLGHREPCHPDADPNYSKGMSDPCWVCPHSGMETTLIHSLHIGYPNNDLEWYQNTDTQYLTSDPRENIDGEIDCLQYPGVVHQSHDSVLEFGPWSHDPQTKQSINRNHKVIWIE